MPVGQPPTPRIIKWFFLAVGVVILIPATATVAWVIHAWLRGVDPPFDQSAASALVVTVIWAALSGAVWLVARSLRSPGPA